MSKMIENRFDQVFDPTPALFSRRVASTLNSLPLRRAPYRWRRLALALAVPALAAGIALVWQGDLSSLDRVTQSNTAMASAAPAATKPMATAAAAATLEPSAAATQAATAAATQAAVATAAVEATPAPDRLLLENGLSYASMQLPNSDPAIGNILLLCEKLDGIVIKPGRTISFWTSVGQETRKNLNTLTTAGDGGMLQSASGVNMVSTVIYQAAACAGLTITQRNTSAIAPAFAILGQDAYVDYAKGKDLKITNPYKKPITLRLRADNFAQGVLECAFAGTAPEKPAEIELKSTQTKELAALSTTKYVANSAIPRGRASVVPAHAGSIVRTEKVITDSSGETSVESFSTDTYPAEGTIIYYNPKDKPDVSKLNTEGPIEDYFGETAWEDVPPKIQKSLKEIYTDEQLAMLFAPRKFVILPDVTGLSEAQAIAKLASIGVVARVSYQDSGKAGVADGVCYGMDVEPGQRWHTDANISIYVQKQETHKLLPSNIAISTQHWTDPIALRYLALDVMVDLLGETWKPVDAGQSGRTSLDATLEAPGLSYGPEGVTDSGNTIWDAAAMKGQEFYRDLSMDYGQDMAAFSTYEHSDGADTTAETWLYIADTYRSRGIRVQGYQYPCFVDNWLYATSPSKGGIWKVDPYIGSATEVAKGWHITRMNPVAAGDWILFQGYQDGKRPALYAFCVTDGRVVQVRPSTTDSNGNEMEYTFIYGGLGTTALMHSEQGWLLFSGGETKVYEGPGTVVGFIASDGTLVLREGEGITLTCPLGNTTRRYELEPFK